MIIDGKKQSVSGQHWQGPREIRNMRWAGLPAIKFRNLIRFEPEAAKAWLREQR